VRAEECVSHPVFETQSVLLHFSGVDERSGQTEGQAKGGPHRTKS
jgi:hypothetical protein